MSVAERTTRARHVVVLGEALIDLVPERDGRFRAHVGGGPLNTAVGLARLGIPTSLVSGVPSGAFGETIRRHLAESGVDTARLHASSLPSTLAIVESPVDPQFALYTAGTAAFDVGALTSLGAEIAAIHAASLALFLQPSAEATFAVLAREAGRRLICIDPNIRSASGPQCAVREQFERLCALADVVRLSSADHDWLYPGAPYELSMRRVLALGPALVALTLGSEGALAATFTSSARQAGAISFSIVDTVGAGDAFNAAMLAHLLCRDTRTRRDLEALTNGDLANMLAWSCEAAAVNCARVGADPAWDYELRKTTQTGTASSS